MTALHWDSVDNYTSDLLSLVATDPHPSSNYEWACFVGVLAATASLHDGRLDQNDYREQLRGVVAPRRIGAFHNRALAEHLIEWSGEWSISADSKGRNAGRPTKTYHWIGDVA